MKLLIGIRAILNAPVGMVNKSLLALTTFERGLQGLTDLLSVQAVMNVMSYDLSRVGIGHQTQVDKSTVSGQIGDISHPDLLSCVGLNLRTACFEQIGVAAKSMVTVRGLVVRPPGSYEHV
jgi:hypothetical protein